PDPRQVGVKKESEGAFVHRDAMFTLSGILRQERKRPCGGGTNLHEGIPNGDKSTSPGLRGTSDPGVFEKQSINPEGVDISTRQ
ncbi:MAG: hypothetical protein ACOYM3_12905, partial [Terrimicrobiaceae bacterium]